MAVFKPDIFSGYLSSVWRVSMMTGANGADPFGDGRSRVNLSIWSFHCICGVIGLPWFLLIGCAVWQIYRNIIPGEMFLLYIPFEIAQPTLPHFNGIVIYFNCHLYVILGGIDEYL